ncbi:MAG: hypothetical protein Q8O57_10915, partial [Kiritimatiellota bacterium]|nr:hypothetical protein [Kiritimatiellota bacterium]
MNPSAVSSERCNEALQQVLRSRTFSRSEQLRAFLRYVCGKAMEGRAGEIKEYLIGVEALGRPPAYSPAEDSSVRRRAYELRQRLDEFYTQEMPDAAVRIQIPRGSYAPLFLEKVPAPPASVETGRNGLSPLAAGLSRRWNRRGVILAAAVGCLAGAAATGIALRGTSVNVLPLDPVVRDVWGPLLTAESQALICIAGNLHMEVRAAPFVGPSYPAPPEIYPQFRNHRPLAEGARLFMRPIEHAAPMGAVSGVAIMAATLRAAGATYQVLNERASPLASFRGRNVILFGDPCTSNAAAYLMSRAAFTIGYDDAGTRRVIRDRRKPPGHPPAFSRLEQGPGGATVVYGLITVLPTDGLQPASKRTIILSGVGNAGVHGAAEFLASPGCLRDLKMRFARHNQPSFPPAYQV